MPLVLVLLALSPAHAADEVRGANLEGMGGVSLAASRDNAAITTNPGLLGLHRRYDGSAMFRYGPSGGMHWGVSAMDGRTSDVVALGLQYSGDLYEPPLGVDELPGWSLPGAEVPNWKRLHELAMGLAVPLADRRLSIGLGGHVALFRHDRQGNGVEGNLDVGVGLRPTDGLVVGLTGQNLLPLPNPIARPLRVGAGVRLEDPRIAAVEVDAAWEQLDVDLPVTVAAGLDKGFGQVLHLRGGWRYEGPLERHLVTFGLGADRDGAGIEYALGVPLDGSGLAGTVHSVSLRFQAPAPIEEP